MKVRKMKYKTIIAVLLAVVMSVLPVCAADSTGTRLIEPRFNHTATAELTITFTTDNVVHGTLLIGPYNTAAGVSGMMKLFDANGNVLDLWSVSDYTEPFAVENTYQGQYGATYTLYFKGYVYSNNSTAPDSIELQVTGTCK